MDIRTNIPLKNFTTMRLGGPAKFFADAHTQEEARQLYVNAKKQNIPFFIIGGGSNLIATDEGFNGLVIRIRIPGFEVIEDTLNNTTIKVGAGEIWDTVVQRSVDMNLSGIEAMSAIPGTAGAAPVQNVGAYGQEIAETLVSLDAYDTLTDQFVTIQNQDCNFSYRHSIFRGEQKGRFIITSITLRLSKSLPAPPFYDTLQQYLDNNRINLHTQKTIRDAVIAIRSEKLPDPTVTPNSGSFFKNALVEKWQAESIQDKHPDLKYFEMANGQVKIPSGWLIEKSGLKGQIFNGIRVYEKNALVLVNESATGYTDLATARQEIINKVLTDFQITIEQEPLEISSVNQ